MAAQGKNGDPATVAFFCLEIGKPDIIPNGPDQICARHGPPLGPFLLHRPRIMFRLNQRGKA
jgi:hypothetical protein